MDYFISDFKSSQFRVNNPAEFINDSDIIQSAKYFGMKLTFCHLYDDSFYVELEGDAIGMHICNSMGEFDYVENKVEFDLCGHIKKHIHPEDRCEVIITSEELVRREFHYRVAAITSTEIQLNQYSVGAIIRHRISDK